MNISNTIKATQAGKANVGYMYFGVLDHPPQRLPSVVLIPPEASEGRVQFRTARLTEISIASQPPEFQGVEITTELIKKTLDWIHDRLYHITHDYEWQIAKNDKDAVVGLNYLIHVLQTAWKNSTSDNSSILFPTRHLLCVFFAYRQFW